MRLSGPWDAVRFAPLGDMLTPLLYVRVVIVPSATWVLACGFLLVDVHAFEWSSPRCSLLVFKWIAG